MFLGEELVTDPQGSSLGSAKSFLKISWDWKKFWPERGRGDGGGDGCMVQKNKQKTSKQSCNIPPTGMGMKYRTFQDNLTIIVWWKSSLKVANLNITRFFYKHIQIGTEARLCLDKFQIEAQIMLIVCLNDPKTALKISCIFRIPLPRFRHQK